MRSGRTVRRPWDAPRAAATPAVLGDPDLLPEWTEDRDPLAVSRGTGRRTARGLARIGRRGHST